MKKLLIISILLGSVVVYSQTGIQTKKPNVVFHIDGKKDNLSPPTDSQIKNDVLITEKGYFGVGVLEPKVRVDLRSNLDHEGIAVGQIDIAANIVGQGAIRYNNIKDLLQYSDGEKWIDFIIVPKEKISISSKLVDENLVNFNNKTQVKGFEDSTNNYWDATNGEFTAPRDGFYMVNFKVSFKQLEILDSYPYNFYGDWEQDPNNPSYYFQKYNGEIDVRRNSTFKVQIKSNQPANNNANEFTSIYSFTGPVLNVDYIRNGNYTAISGSLIGSVSGVFNLKSGEKLNFFVTQDFASLTQFYYLYTSSGPQFYRFEIFPYIAVLSPQETIINIVEL